MKPTLLLLGLISFASGGYASVVTDQMETISQYLVLTSPTVAVRKTADPTTAEIVIKPTSNALVSLSPSRFSRNIPARKLTTKIWGEIFESSSIPASLTWVSNNSAERGVFLNVSLKSINEKAGIITLTASVNGTATATLSDKASHVGKPITYGVLQNASITLDDQQGRVIRGDGSKKSNARNAMAFTENTVQVIGGCTIQPYGNCSTPPGYYDLTGANLSNVDLTGVNWSGMYMPNANLSGANLTNADLSGYSNLTGVSLSGATLTGVNLSNSDWSNLTLQNLDLTGLQLSGSAGLSADFTGSNLTGANLSGISWTTVNVTNATVTNIQLSGTVPAQSLGTQTVIGCATAQPALRSAPAAFPPRSPRINNIYCQ